MVQRKRNKYNLNAFDIQLTFHRKRGINIISNASDIQLLFHLIALDDIDKKKTKSNTKDRGKREGEVKKPYGAAQRPGESLSAR